MKGPNVIDLRHLNDWASPPPFLTLEMDVEIVDGMEDFVFAPGLEPGVVLIPGIGPALVDEETALASGGVCDDSTIRAAR